MAAIIARQDALNKPVIFLLDTLDDSGNIQAWHPDTENTIASDISFYKTTHSVSDSIEAEMANKYVAKFGLGNDFQIRRKLYRYSHRPAVNNSGNHAKDIEPLGPTQPTHVITKQMVTIPIEEFTNKIIAALQDAVKEALK